MGRARCAWGRPAPGSAWGRPVRIRPPRFASAWTAAPFRFPGFRGFRCRSFPAPPRWPTQTSLTPVIRLAVAQFIWCDLRTVQLAASDRIRVAFRFLAPSEADGPSAGSSGPRSTGVAARYRLCYNHSDGAYRAVDTRERVLLALSVNRYVFPDPLIHPRSRYQIEFLFAFSANYKTSP